MKKIIVSLLVLAAPFSVFAQLKVTDLGKVCIVNNAPYGNANLSVGNYSGANAGNANINSQIRFTSTDGTKSFGAFNLVLGKSTNNAQTIGVMGAVATGYNGKLYGVLGAIPQSKCGAGIYGTTGVSGSVYGQALSGTYAGYFEGTTYVNGSLTATEVITPSDIRLKENIVSVSDEEEKTGGSTLDRLMGMNVIKYTYKPKLYAAASEDERGIFEDEASASEAEEAAKKELQRMAEQKHYGLSAQELTEIYPDLVRESQDGTLGVNYVELVPVLIRAIQELKEELDAAKGNDAARKAPAATQINDATKSGNVLFQNTPNPFKEQTTIRFSLADDAQSAFICIFDMTGKMLKKLPISSGETSVSVNGWELGEGMFLYSLMVNGQEIDTKRMILSK